MGLKDVADNVQYAGSNFWVIVHSHMVPFYGSDWKVLITGLKDVADNIWPLR